MSKIDHLFLAGVWETLRRRSSMAKLITTANAPQFSNSEINRMLSWLTNVARDESESQTLRKNACVATLSMAELFELGSTANQRLNTLFVQLKDRERNSKVARNSTRQEIACTILNRPKL
jgi:hypothetical protein